MELGTNKLQASLYRYPLKGFRAVKGQKRGFLLTVSRSPPLLQQVSTTVLAVMVSNEFRYPDRQCNDAH